MPQKFLVYSIKSKITYKVCAINLDQKKIKIKNAAAKSLRQIDKLIKQDGVYIN